MLTPENYFSPDRPHVSVSQIKDYLRDPGFYKRRYIDRDPDVQFKVTDPVQRGAVVDGFLTSGGSDIRPRVLKKDNPELYEIQKDIGDRYLIGQTYYDQAMQVVGDVRRHPVWKDGMQEADYQSVLEGEVAGVKVCGLADRVDTLKGAAGIKLRLVDLKVVSAVKLDSARKWLWNVIEMGYDLQFAMYRRLLAEKHGLKKHEIECAHVVAAFVETGLTKVRAYKIPGQMLDAAEHKLEHALRGIASQKFDERLTTWMDAETVPFGTAGDELDADIASDVTEEEEA